MARRFNLAGELIAKIVQQRIGTTVKGKIDGDTIYTDAFIARESARARGVLSAITKY